MSSWDKNSDAFNSDRVTNSKCEISVGTGRKVPFFTQHLILKVILQLSSLRTWLDLAFFTSVGSGEAETWSVFIQSLGKKAQWSQ